MKTFADKKKNQLKYKNMFWESEKNTQNEQSNFGFKLFEKEIKVFPTKINLPLEEQNILGFIIGWKDLYHFLSRLGVNPLPHNGAF